MLEGAVADGPEAHRRGDDLGRRRRLGVKQRAEVARRRDAVALQTRDLVLVLLRDLVERRELIVRQAYRRRDSRIVPPLRRRQHVERSARLRRPETVATAPRRLVVVIRCAGGQKKKSDRGEAFHVSSYCARR